MTADREDIRDLMPIIRDFCDSTITVLEIGPDLGNGSTRAIGKSYQEGTDGIWVTVDIDDHILPECRPTFSGWFFVQGDSREPSTVQKVLQYMQVADLIFIDTIHEKPFLARELSVWSGMAYRNTVWLFHDTWMGGVYNTMTDAIKEFAEAHRNTWKYVDIAKHNNGLGALIPVDWREGIDYEVYE